MSSTPSAEEQGRSVGAGASDYIKMPFNARDVAEKILMELALHKAVAPAPHGATPPRPLHPQTLEVNYHSILAGSPDAVLLFDIDNSLLIDAMTLPLPVEQRSIIKGDAKSVSIAAASIVAKVYRDRLMSEYALQYPHYGFEKNAGYGTQLHLAGLDTHGITPIHRKTFDPIKSMLRGQ